MAEGKSFNCPNCGSPLIPDGEEEKVNCKYCGSLVIVPDELRDEDDSLFMGESPEHPQKVREIVEKELRVKKKRPTEEAINDLTDCYDMVDMEGLNKIEGFLDGFKNTLFGRKALDELNRKIEDVIRGE